MDFDEKQDEIEFYKQERWEKENHMDYFRTVVRDSVEYHMAGYHCMYKCDPKTGRAIK